MSEEPRVIVIGVDGGSFRLIRPWADQGVLPNFARLMREGAWGDLRSTDPGLTAPAWAAFKTGKQPGNNGIYDFFYRETDTLKHRVVDANRIKEPTLIDIINREGRKVGMLFEPTSFPARPLDGFMIAGFLTPSFESKGYAYPEDLFESHGLQRDGALLKVDVGRFFKRGEIDALLEAIEGNLRSQAEIALRLMDEEAWDLFMVHLFATDTVCHCMWRFLDEGSPHFTESNPRYRDAALKIFRIVDEVVGEFLARLGGNDHLVVLSDHGFGPGYERFNINNWLIEKGYLRLRDVPVLEAIDNLLAKVAQVRRGGRGISLTERLASGGLRAFRALCVLSGGALRSYWSTLFNRWLDRAPHYKTDAISDPFYFDQIDWGRTRAYAMGARGGIHINLKGREARGVVEPGAEYEALREEIIIGLNQVTDSRGRLIVANAAKREEVYYGRYLEAAPDVVTVREERGYLISAQVGKGTVTSLPPGRSGLHRTEGIFLALGPEIAAGQELNGARIIDVAPTILHLMGLGVPDDMDGAVLTAALDPVALQRHPVRLVPAIGRDEAAGAHDDDEDAELLEKLAGLGYI